MSNSQHETVQVTKRIVWRKISAHHNHHITHTLQQSSCVYRSVENNPYTHMEICPGVVLPLEVTSRSLIVNICNGSSKQLLRRVPSRCTYAYLQKRRSWRWQRTRYKSIILARWTVIGLSRLTRHPKGKKALFLKFTSTKMCLLCLCILTDYS